ncbi:hypothetical protein GCM10027035_46890 [Emticicia sediminis]
MFILSLLIIEILLYLSIATELIFCYLKKGEIIDSINIGLYPNVYTKTLKKTKFSLGMIPLTFHHNVKEYSPEKAEKLKYWQMTISLFPVFIIHSFTTLYLFGLKGYLLFYKALLTFNFESFYNLHLFNITNTFDIYTIQFFTAAVANSAITLLFYLVVLRNFMTATLSLTLGILRVPAFNFFAVVIAYSTIIYLFVKSGAKNLFLIVKYNSVVFWVIDILIAHSIFIILLAISLEILSITQQKNIEN